MKQAILSTYRGELSFHQRLEQELSTYPEKTIHADGSVMVEHINNPYFLVNDKWNINFIGEIKHFKRWWRIISTQLKISIFESKVLRLI